MLEHHLTPTLHQLILQAKTGDPISFNELVLRYRKKAVTWAADIVQDRYLAEDVAQEAFIQVIMKLSSLEHPERFVPWFRRIVRNQALMKVRRGGHLEKEQLLADGDNVESLSKSDAYLASYPQDPADTAINQESSATFISLLQCLNKRERSVFEAHYFDSLTFQEIAAKLSMTVNHLYATMSRARSKMQQHHHQTILTQYLEARRVQAAPERSSVEEKGVYFGEVWDTFSLFVLHALQYTEKPHISKTEIMGLTGQAFRLQINQRQSSVNFMTHTIPSHGDSTFSRGLSHLGLTARWISESHRLSPREDMLIEALSFIHDTIDRGQIAMIWGVHLPFFGWITGYDDASRSLRLSGMFGYTELPYDQLGRDSGTGHHLFVLSLDHASVIHPVNSLRGALQDIVLHGEGKVQSERKGNVIGLAAYDAWIDMLRECNMHPSVHILLIWETSANRQSAAEFLSEVADRNPKHYGIHGAMVTKLAKQASADYTQVARLLASLRLRFPVASSHRQSLNTDAIDESVRIIGEVRQLEERGLCKLKSIIPFL